MRCSLIPTSCHLDSLDTLGAAASQQSPFVVAALMRRVVYIGLSAYQFRHRLSQCSMNLDSVEFELEDIYERR